MRKSGRIILPICVALLLAVHYVAGKPENNAIDEDPSEEESVETSSVPVFVRSRFNLRVWSTTESALKNESAAVETTEAPVKKASPTAAVVKLKRTRTTTTTTVTPPTPEPEEATGSSVSEDAELVATTTEGPKPPKQPSCGELNGDDVPWIAVLEHTNPSAEAGSNKKTLSKGVLIDDRHVLTTISSIHNSYPFWVVSRVRLGDTPTWASAQGGRETNQRKRGVVAIPVKNVFLHERKDIAVIRLAERVNVTAAVRPVCLPGSDRFNYTELHFHVCRKERPQGSAPLMGRAATASKLVAVTSLGQKDCQILFRRHQAEIGAKEFCAWDETGDNCTGDLGGPLMAKLQGRYHVVGLNSYALAKSKIDSEGLPGVYVRVGSFLKWIQAVLRTEFADSS